MRILHLSDTHGFHYQLDYVENLDMVIHSGDVANALDLGINANEVLDFLEWYRRYPCPIKILVPGNHDCSIWQGLVTEKAINDMGIITLINQEFVHEGLKFWGSPYTPKLFDHYNNWAWGLKRNEMDIVWKLIPENTKILITHGPPKGIMDLTLDHKDRETPTQAGDAILMNTVLKSNIAIHMFGHIHEERGFLNAGLRYYKGKLFSNGSCAGKSKLQLLNYGNLISI
jgi:Icc-related predicted phosphoesterase